MAQEMTPTQLQAWRALYRADTLLFTHIENTLRARLKMSYFEHEVLRILDAAGGRLRMAPLAEQLMISRSGATRLVGKLEEKDGYVARRNTPEDRRATWAELTDDGRKALKEAQPVVEAVVATFFADHVSNEDLRAASRILDVLADANPNDDGFDCGL
ncbi:MarR family transcriptional regulator [Kribbella sandramycini]|uniref:MarR family transcriptional regulator n=1 Tax=Kribbella sandramycini TaxID=60450 RepID=A0A7Y4P0B5_9ACTN|nr:MarR family transcriptional regulator [Kribbella sandramycini]MBB6566362.1 DNA-binding MarR family transcriptional regulator [Kribbella sandramycini]NOL42977.1 MarR family transcriptional regulator [Kribbella sandramycini]